MAQLKDSLITGDLRVTGTIYGNVPLNDLVDADDLKAIEALTDTAGLLKKTGANTWTLDTTAYKTGTVTSVRVQATSPVVSSVNTAQSSSLNTTISLADNYGDTKNPYASKTARYVLAAPASAAGVPSFRALTNADVGLSNVENTKLSTWAGSSNITTIGTLSSGTVPWARLSDVPTASTSAAGIIQIGTGSGNAAAGNHNHDSAYVNVSGDTMTGKLTVGTTSQSAAPTASITIHDTRNYTWTPTSLDKGVNWYFTQTGSPDTSKWWSIMHLTGWTGDYNAWELAGPSHNSDQRTVPLYVRTGRTTNGWGSWRKIYDTSNKPTAADVGVSATTSSVTVGSTTFSKYEHPTGDGNKHVPATGTTNNNKFLKAGSTAGSLSWASVTKSDVGLGKVENTKLSTWTGSSYITTIGTLSSGTVPWARLSNVPTASTSAAGIIQIGTASTNAAAGNHTHSDLTQVQIVRW